MELKLEKIANGWLVHANGVGEGGSPARHCDEIVLSGANYCADNAAVVAMFKDMAEQHFSLQEANHKLVMDSFQERKVQMWNKGKEDTNV